MIRKLVSIQKIATVQPIIEADNIEVVTMENLGWHCVVKKGIFKPGDLCVYHEVDCLLPNIPIYFFLSIGSFIKKSIIESGKEVEGYRLKTKKIKNIISQGLVLPLDILSNFGTLNKKNLTLSF